MARNRSAHYAQRYANFKHAENCLIKEIDKANKVKDEEAIIEVDVTVNIVNIVMASGVVIKRRRR